MRKRFIFFWGREVLSETRVHKCSARCPQTYPFDLASRVQALKLCTTMLGLSTTPPRPSPRKCIVKLFWLFPNQSRQSSYYLSSLLYTETVFFQANNPNGIIYFFTFTRRTSQILAA